jgi:hypothetical protein
MTSLKATNLGKEKFIEGKFTPATERFHTKMEMIQRRTCGFRNFDSRSEAETGFTNVKQRSGNYRLRGLSYAAKEFRPCPRPWERA